MTQRTRRCASFAVDTRICVHSSGCAAPLMEAAAVYASQLHAACVAANDAARTLACLAGDASYSDASSDNVDGSSSRSTSVASVPAYVHLLLRAAATTALKSTRRGFGTAIATSSSLQQQQQEQQRRAAVATACKADNAGNDDRRTTTTRRAQLLASLDDDRLASQTTAATRAMRFAGVWSGTVATVYARDEVLTQWARARAAVAQAECAQRLQLYVLHVRACEADARAALCREHAVWQSACAVQQQMLVDAAVDERRARVLFAQHAYASKQRHYEAWLRHFAALKLNEVERRAEVQERQSRRRLPWFLRPGRASPPPSSSSSSSSSPKAHASPPTSRTAIVPSGARATRAQQPPPQPQQRQQQARPRQLQVEAQQTQRQRRAHEQTARPVPTPLPPLARHWSSSNDMPVAMSVEEEAAAKWSLWQ